MSKYLDHATMRDAEALLQIKNDPDVRRFSIVSKDPILIENHLRWLELCLADPNRHLYCIRETTSDIVLGDVRLDVEAFAVEVSVRLRPEVRRRGIGSWAVDEACRKANLMYPGRTLVAKILPENEASRATFRKCGFTPEYDRSGILFYERA